MKLKKLRFQGLMLIEQEKFYDDRGHFMESYNYNKFDSQGLKYRFLQDNNVRSHKNVLRGLHFQKLFPQTKLINCLKGKIFDVCVDMRKSSSTYGDWFGQELSDVNNYQLLIPAGFAHGYYVMSDYAEISYKCTEVYHPDDEFGVLWNDPNLNIKWPCDAPILSDKDKKWPLFNY